MSFPTNAQKRLNHEPKGETNVVGIFPNESAVVAMLLERNDKWVVQRSRRMALETPRRAFGAGI
jgi:transposase-like protein